MMVKLSPGLNFTNILYTAFTSEDFKSGKKTVKSSSFLSFRDLHGSKAARKHVDEIEPRSLTAPSLKKLRMSISALSDVRGMAMGFVVCAWRDKKLHQPDCKNE